MHETTPEGIKEQREQALYELKASLNNEEVIYVTEKYLFDNENTDLQRLLTDTSSRSAVIRELEKVSKVAYYSLVQSLADSAKSETGGVNYIIGSQEKVDSLAESLIEQNSPLLIENKFPLPEDENYWDKESEFIQRRKSSGDSRWTIADDRNAIESLIKDAREYEIMVEHLLTDVISEACVGDRVVGTSQRTKGVDSLIKKIEKFRESDWGKDATVADAVDLIGGRIVLEDLESLEKVMQCFEQMDELNRIKVLRKENKFIVNNGRTDPYRAIHYTIEIPETLQTAEIQLKTLSSMVASDLYHNAIYKPHILNLPSELQDSIRNYNWRSVEDEMIEYAAHKDINVKEDNAENHNRKLESIIETLDYNLFYDEVLSKIDASRPIPNETKIILEAFHNIEKEKLFNLMTEDENLVLTMAAVAHNSYYEKAVADMVNDTSKPQLGNEIPESALSLLSQQAQDLYKSRYDNYLNGLGNKLSALDLELDKLAIEDIEKFFELSGKDISKGKVAELIEAIGAVKDGSETTDKLKTTNIVNIFQAKFDELLTAPVDSEGNKYDVKSNQYQQWRDSLILTQLNAIASSSILTEISGNNIDNQKRDIYDRTVPGLPYTIREFLIFAFFVSADRKNSEFADYSYESYVTDEGSEWARDFDKHMDLEIMKGMTETQLITISEMIEDSSNNPVKLARLQKARIELLAKKMSSFNRNKEASELWEIAKTESLDILESNSRKWNDVEINRRFMEIEGIYSNIGPYLLDTPVENFGMEFRLNLAKSDELEKLKMNNHLWGSLPIQEIPLRGMKILARESSLSSESISRVVSGELREGYNPHILIANEGMVVIDGHHRVAMNYTKNKEIMPAVVYDIRDAQNNLREANLN